MKAAQRYVSDELSHFVGGVKPEEEQYDMLVKQSTEIGLANSWASFTTQAFKGVSLDPFKADQQKMRQ